MRNFRLYLIVGLMTFSIGIIASRFLISSQVEYNCAGNITMTVTNGKESQFPQVMIKSSDGRWVPACQEIVKSSWLF
jgi:hypothetical protein